MSRHGTRRGYQGDKCRCEECRRWMRDQARADRAKARANQPPKRVPAGPVADHIRTQQAKGWRGTDIARAAGVAKNVIYRILNGHTPWIRSVTADKLLAVDLDQLDKPTPKPPTRQPHPVCCQLCDDLGWLLTNGETLPIVAVRLDMSEESARWHVARYLPDVWENLHRESQLLQEYA